MAKFKEFVQGDKEVYDSRPETQEHRDHVYKGIHNFIKELMNRSTDHDKSKMEDPELVYFDKYTPMLKKLEYGTDEYKKSLDELKPALDHHYKVNSHHPEHFKNGINGMNLVDLIEMICDWYSATKRTKGGDIHKSIDISAKRFNIDPQLLQIIKNSLNLVDETI